MLAWIRLLPLLWLAGCSLHTLDLVTPKDGYRLRSDIRYGPSPRQQLDVYEPEAPRASAPTVVFFYGGGWRSGFKGGYRFVAQALAEDGYRVVIPDYRLHPEVRFPAFVEDSARSLDRVARLGLAESGVVLMGHSAGAHIAALLALDRTYLENTAMRREHLLAWVGLSGPYDFMPLTDPDLIEVFGARDGLPRSQPVNWVSADDPPALVVYGQADRQVGPRNHRALVAAYESVGAEIETRLYPQVDHIDTVLAFSPRFRGRSPVYEDVLDYLADISNRSVP